MFATSLILLAALDLGTLFAEKDAWNTKSEFFAVEHAKDGFAFASESRDIVNCLKHDTCTRAGFHFCYSTDWGGCFSRGRFRPEPCYV